MYVYSAVHRINPSIADKKIKEWKCHVGVCFLQWGLVDWFGLVWGRKMSGNVPTLKQLLHQHFACLHEHVWKRLHLSTVWERSRDGLPLLPAPSRQRVIPHSSLSTSSDRRFAYPLVFFCLFIFYSSQLTLNLNDVKKRFPPWGSGTNC